MQSYIDSKKNSAAGFVPLIMLTEEMYKANFILDKWLNRKNGLKDTEGMEAAAKNGQEAQKVDNEEDND